MVISSYCLIVLGDIFSKKSGCGYDFFSSDKNYDVLIIGSSVSQSGISPLDLWDKFGITSYNLSGEGQPLANNYWLLRNAIKFHKPKVVVVELGFLFYDRSWSKDTPGGRKIRAHELFDNMPFSIEKYKAIIDLVPLKYLKEFLLPRIFYYHERWRNLNKNDFAVIHNKKINPYLSRGGTIRDYSEKDGVIFDTSSFEKPFGILPKTEIKKCSYENELYINKMIEICKKNKIKILFMVFPEYADNINLGSHGNGFELQRKWNYIEQKLSEKKIDCINCLRHIDEIGFEYSKDLRDYYHQNLSGNRKMTHYLGRILQEKYGIKNQKDKSFCRKWNNEYKIFNKYREKVINEKIKLGKK